MCVVHHCLKCGEGVAHSEKHYRGFVQSSIGLERGFLLVPFFDLDVVVAPMDIQFSKVFPVFDLVHQFGNQGKGVCILDRPLIQVPIILARS